METASEHARQAGGRTAAEKYLCMLLYAPGGTGRAGEPVGGGAWLQMQMHVLSRDVPELGKEIIGFEALGPALDAAYGRCAGAGLVAGGEDGGGIRLTPRGMEEAEALWGEADGDARGAVADAKGLLNDMDYWELVSFMRSEFPETAEAQEIAGDLEGRRLGAAASLAGRQKVSVSRAAEIAGMGTVEFEAELERRGIRPYYTDAKGLEESMKVIDRIIGR